MWHNYFFQIQSKYNMRISLNNPLVIRLDGKDVTKNKNINFMHDFKGSFSNALFETTKEFSTKYKAYAIFGSDEISFIFPKTDIILADMSNDNCIRTNEIISVFSQMFYQSFNDRFIDSNKILWHGKCFSINENKLISYIKYRSLSIENVMLTYFLKRRNIKAGMLKREAKLEYCKKFDDYDKLEKIKNGILFYDGNKINLNEFLKNNNIEYEKNNESNVIEFIGLDDF